MQLNLFIEEKKHIYPSERFKKFSSDICWQYRIRNQNEEDDLFYAGLSKKEVNDLTVKDFEFRYIDKEDKEGCKTTSEFIKRHEWLGKMPGRPTHRFVATYKGHYAGVIVMSTPNAFADYGLERNMEKLISRGACISWSPKNLGSFLIMSSIKWMTKNTDFRIFSAYSDPEAGELGTLYQACNFYYIGNNFGGTKQYFDKDRPELGWFSDRSFRLRSRYYWYVQKIGINPTDFKKRYIKGDFIEWEKVPPEVRIEIKKEEKKYRESCLCRDMIPKHKYLYVLGKDKRETKYLRKTFLENNKTYDYPTKRGS